MALAPEPAPRASAAPVPPAAVPDDEGFAMPRMRPAG